MHKVVIIDDEPLARSVVVEFIKDFPQLQVMATCGDGFEGVKAIQEHQPDLIFLDVQMPKINGFEMLELVDEPPSVIFATAFDEYAIKAFEANAVDYLLKPFSKERFATAINKWQEQQAGRTALNMPGLLDAASQTPAQSQRIVVKTGTKIKIIPTQDVFYLEAADNFVKVHTREGAFLKNKTMAHFEQILPTQEFARCHRSYMINLQEITRIEPYEKDSHIALLRNGSRVPVSRSGYARLKEILGL